VPAVATFAGQVSIALENSDAYQDMEVQAEDLSRAWQVRTAFLQKMSHELRTPLNAVIGFSSMLQKQRTGSLYDKQARYIDNIRSSGEDLLVIINNVIDLTAIESGEMELNPLPLPLLELIISLFAEFNEAAQEKGILLKKTNITPDHVILADRVRFRQIIYNLFDNAIKFTPQGGMVSVKSKVVSGQWVVDSGGGSVDREQQLLPTKHYTLITVKDTGIGIKAEYYSKVFSDFERIDSPASQKDKGPGLGLVITKHLVELHDGRIWFESDGVPGEGTTFYVALPAVTDIIWTKSDE